MKTDVPQVAVRNGTGSAARTRKGGDLPGSTLAHGHLPDPDPDAILTPQSPGPSPVFTLQGPGSSTAFALEGLNSSTVFAPQGPDSSRFFER